MYEIPVLFVFFNRPAIAQEAFSRIRAARPSRLYLASDGARKDKEGECAIVAQTRQIILDSVDWECEVRTLFRDENLGCGPGVYSAISWFMENEEFGIIIEDDCVVNSSFFSFMREMLLSYKDDQRIGMVSGSNLVDSYKEQRFSYLFSRYKSCWGWGTWRRSWKNMDINMKWRGNYVRDVVSNSGLYGRGIRKWLFQLKCIDEGYVSAWDWQWFFSLAAQNQLCIYPAVNLVTNIGNDRDATHTSFSNISFRSYDLSFPLKAPDYVCPDERFDHAFFKDENRLADKVKRMIPNSLKSSIKNFIVKIKK